MKKILVFINFILIAGLLLGHLYQFSWTGDGYILIICALLYPYLAIGVFICFIFLLLFRSPWMILSLVILFLHSGTIQRQIGLKFNQQSISPADSGYYSIMTFNTKDDFRFKDIDQKEAFVADHAETPPQILAMQEVSRSTVDNLKERMNYHHTHYQGTSNPANGLAVFSKFPLKNEVSIKNDEGHLIASSCDITLPGGTIRLINLHLHTNAVTLRVNRFSPESISQKEGLRSLLKMIRSYRETAKKRMKELEYIRAEIADSPYPVMLAGDVNDVPVSPVYRNLKTGMTDVFTKAGLGFAQTYNESFLALKIDHIFVDSKFQVIKSNIDRINYSDHNPVSTVFTLVD